MLLTVRLKRRTIIECQENDSCAAKEMYDALSNVNKDAEMCIRCLLPMSGQLKNCRYRSGRPLKTVTDEFTRSWLWSEEEDKDVSRNAEVIQTEEQDFFKKWSLESSRRPRYWYDAPSTIYPKDGTIVFLRVTKEIIFPGEQERIQRRGF